MRVKYKLKEEIPGIWSATFEDPYDLAMTFWRCQETYESPKFRNKKFSLVEYMRWYAGAFGKGAFTYATDWTGFNVPSSAIKRTYDKGWHSDFNNYDEEFLSIRDRVEKRSSRGSYYLIGSVEGNQETKNHEIAHGLFHTRPAYRRDMRKLVRSLDGKFRCDIFDALKQMGYHSSVFVDETQAFFSTGLVKELTDVFKKHDPHPTTVCHAFREVFNIHTAKKKA
jgi:hypothetical protein